MLREMVWRLRHRFRLNKVGRRPVLDLVEFGRERCVVLDVGAHKGGFAGDILLRAPLAEVHCFEPNPNILPPLKANAARYGTFRNRPRCVVSSCAVGDVEQSQPLIVTGLSSASSLLAVTDNVRSGWPDANFAEQSRTSVQVVRLDRYLATASIDFVKLLKLDIQGYELAALRGCGDRLRDIEYIIAEVQFCELYAGAPLWHELANYCISAGFTPVVMDGFCFGPSGAPLQADILFQNRSTR